MGIISAIISIFTMNLQAQTASFRYKAKLPEGIYTIKDAQQEILNFLNKKETVHFYSDKPYFRVKLLSNKTFIDKAKLEDDEIVITTSLTTFSFKAVKSFNEVFMVWEERIQRESGKHSIMYQLVINYPGEITINLYSSDKDLMCRLADAIYFVKKQSLADSASIELTRFASIVAKDKGLATKQPVNEEQRKYIVQANAATQIKEFGQAINYFSQALQINETAFPDAYFNMALIFAQRRQFDQAILNMKKYIIILPDSPDARVAQDKIYEWEAGINK